MRFYPTKIHLASLCFVFISISLNLGCSKDSDLLVDTVISNSESSVIVQNQDVSTESTEEEQVEEVTEDPNPETSLVLRTTSFSPLHDAHVQSGRGYNQNIIRLEEGSRTSYLMFDLSRIADISGTIMEATLQFTIDSDDGSGTVNVYRGASSEWTENTLSDESAPEAVIQIGSIAKAFNIGETQAIDLDVADMLAEVKTLVLQHKDGNDLAFASKEHVSKIGPKLVVSYEVDESAEEIGDTNITEETNENQNSTEENIENQEPMAVADASPSSGAAPLEVTFQGANSTDDISVENYRWDFKDGATSSETNPTHTFTAVGVYEVELTVTDEEGLSTTDKVTITVNENENEAPKAVVSATPTTGEVPLEVSFKGSDSSDDNSIATYGWDFKDGSKTNIADFNYTYEEPGTYEAELTVTDENGLTDKATITITVTEPQNEAPTAVATANITSGPAPLDVQFIGDKSTDDNGITSYFWDFKDGSNASTANPSHKFNAAGSYVVELTVKDAAGLVSKKTITIVATEPQNTPPIAVATASPSSGKAPLTVQFLGNSSSDNADITSYLWDFKNGSTATSINPSHTFNNPGIYDVSLTVKDAEGLSNTKEVKITVEENVNNSPPGFYVATNGSSSNNGTSPSSPWSLEHAFSVAKAGNTIYIKAGNYSNQNPVGYSSGSSGNPIKFIGYRNSPGDISSSNTSTFSYGQSINATTMPLLTGSSSNSGIGIDINGSYIEIHNIQITKYRTGLESKGGNVLLKNIITTDNGVQTNNNSNTGRGFQIYGNYTEILNCFVLNSNAEGINLKGAKYCKIRNSQVYCDNRLNPTSYYIVLGFGASNNIVENSTIYRDSGADLHRGHGFTLKDLATNNIIRNSKAYNTGIEVNFSGVYSNTFDNIQIYGSYSSDGGEFTSSIRILNGAHDNTFKNVTVDNSLYGVNFHDFNDGFIGQGGDRDKREGGHNNQFINLIVKNTRNVVTATSDEGGSATFSNNNSFKNCTFQNIERSPFISYHDVNGTSFNNCLFENMPSNELKATYSGGSFPASFTNCTFRNVGFTRPN